jgi:hypothetical protein
MENRSVDTAVSRMVHVEAQADHLESLTRGKPVNALAELIWNALDADADLVKVSVIDNELGSPSEIHIVDNGQGISLDHASRAFGNLGGSLKRERKLADANSKKVHGRNGKGRFKAFALGHEVAWDTTYLDENQNLQHYVIKGVANRLQDFEIGSVETATGRRPGTSVLIKNVNKSVGTLSRDGATNKQLAEVFALFLRNYPATQIFFRQELVDPKSVQKAYSTVVLPSFTSDNGEKISGELDIVEWTFSKKERRIYLCDQDGFALHEVEAGIRPGRDFNFTAYIRSDYVAKLNQENLLVLDELNADLRTLIEHSRAMLRTHFRRRKAETASELVQRWKAEGVYPFAGNPDDALEIARREVFDICALNVHQYLDAFRDGQPKDRKFTLRMLKTALDENPESLKKILTDVLELPKDKQSELAELLQYTTLSAIIEASKMVTDRLVTLEGFKALLFQSNSKRDLRERTQLHRMLEKETWLFGEEYLLTNSDENLNTVLRKHLAALRSDEAKTKKRIKSIPVVRDDGREAVIDLMLAREVPAYAQSRREFLVIELKRPSQKIDLSVSNQILSYAMAVSSDERCDKENTHWTFIAISNEMTPEASRTVRQVGKPYGFFHTEDNLRVGLATWAEVFNASRIRLEAFRKKLDFTATKDQGIAILHTKYAQYLPTGFGIQNQE